MNKLRKNKKNCGLAKESSKQPIYRHINHRYYFSKSTAKLLLTKEMDHIIELKETIIEGNDDIITRESEILNFILSQEFYLNKTIPTLIETSIIKRISVEKLKTLLIENFGEDNLLKIAIQLKVTHAEDLLMDRMSLWNISNKLCFHNLFVFIWYFKKYQGVFPWTWRKRMIDI